MKYHFNDIEAKWQKYWAKHQTFKATNPSSFGGGQEEAKPKYYVLDMFPYPSGAGLHVGHPLGYIASDIYARYKRHKGFNVLHPQGYDSFGLPAEQYAIQTGQHPAITTKENIKTYRRQLDQIGFSYDWSREIRTSDPNYYKWTQWVFIQLFESYYCKDADKARPISELVEVFKAEGNARINAVSDDEVKVFSADKWNSFSSKKQQEILLKYRLTYLAESEVNWCPALGTVLANDEIVNGVSERGGHPVIRKKMTQWSMRISAYAERLLQGLETIDWPDSLKESQRNWIGKSVGAEVQFRIQNSEFRINVFTTRPDTIFGASFITLAPEHELVHKITTTEQKSEIEAYIEATAKRSERDRMADVKTISGVFTGAYAEHPFTKKPTPIWIGDYVLAGYGTGAVMSVPCGDQRDYDFAKHFNIAIPNIFDLEHINKVYKNSPPLEKLEEAFTDKDNTIIANSDFINGMNYKKATKRVIYELEQLGQGEGKINYRLRDAVFSRQRYWGEPFPVYYVNGMPQMIDVAHLPIRLPEVEKYLPTETGEPPLGNASVWAWCTQTNSVVSNDKIVSSSAVETSQDNGVYPLELNTMPGWAGSSQYFNRYMDPNNSEEIFSKDAINYWQQVDLYIGGSEHATGHLLYSRFWQKFMFDKGLVPHDEFAKKLINQGMILGTSAFVYELTTLISYKGEDMLNPVHFALPNQVENLYFISNGFVENIEEIHNNGGQEFFHNKNLQEKFTKEFQERFKGKVFKDNYDIHKYQKWIDDIENCFVSALYIRPIHVPISFLKTKLENGHIKHTNELDIEAFKKWRPEILLDAILLDNNGNVIEDVNQKYIVKRDIEKMSKSKYNVVNPDEICSQYGADSLRMYEMFLGPLEQAKPWNTAGITGVHGFLKKMWKLYHTGENGSFYVDTSPLGKTEGALKTLHKTIKKVEEDIDNFSFNTSVSTFMIAVNELTAQKCTSKEILEPLLILLSPYAPHIAEELWSKLGHNESISTASFPIFNASYLVESSKNYPISFNGKMRFTIELPLDMSKEDIEKAVLAHEKTQAQLQGHTPKKVIVVPGKIVNIVG